MVNGRTLYAGQSPGRLPDPGETREGLKANADDETSLLRALMNVWPGSVSIAKAIEVSVSNQPLQDVLAELPGRDPTQALCTLLRDVRGRNIGGRYFDRTEGRPSRWFVSEALGA